MHTSGSVIIEETVCVRKKSITRTHELTASIDTHKLIPLSKPFMRSLAICMSPDSVTTLQRALPPIRRKMITKKLQNIAKGRITARYKTRQ